MYELRVQYILLNYDIEGLEHDLEIINNFEDRNEVMGVNPVSII